MPGGQAHPEKHALAGAQPWRQAKLLQLCHGVIHGFGEPVSNSFQMFAIAAVAKRAVQNMRGQAVAAETGGGTQVDQALDPWSLGCDITAAQGGRQCFGKTAYLYYAGQPI